MMWIHCVENVNVYQVPVLWPARIFLEPALVRVRKVYVPPLQLRPAIKKNAGDKLRLGLHRKIRNSV